MYRPPRHPLGVLRFACSLSFRLLGQRVKIPWHPPHEGLQRCDFKINKTPEFDPDLISQSMSGRKHGSLSLAFVLRRWQDGLSARSATSDMEPVVGGLLFHNRIIHLAPSATPRIHLRWQAAVTSRYHTCGPWEPSQLLYRGLVDKKRKEAGQPTRRHHAHTLGVRGIDSQKVADLTRNRTFRSPLTSKNDGARGGYRGVALRISRPRKSTGFN